MTHATAIRRFRVVIVLFIIALVFSGITALPLLREVRLLHTLTPPGDTGISAWIATVKSGLEQTYAHYPWMAYGTDWLAFGHFAIACFFVAAAFRPAQSRLIIQAGFAACLLVIPTALICGEVRGIPLGWRFIDCSFGIVGILPLLYCYRLLRLIDPDSNP